MCGASHKLLDLQIQHLMLPADCCRRPQLPSKMLCSKVILLALCEMAWGAQILLVLQEAGLSVQGASAAL